MLFKKTIVAGLLCLFVSIHACKHKQQGIKPIIEDLNTGIPCIKIPLKKKEVHNIEKASWETIAGLFLVQNGQAANVSVASYYSYEEDTLKITPMFFLAEGSTFEIRVKAQNTIYTHRFSTPHNAQAKQTPQIQNIYPLDTVLPANILIFHALFTMPMQENELAFKNVKLLDEQGKEKKMVWREKSNWTNSGKHLVLMLHPGRVKRGINYFKNEGSLFEEGKKYTLVITPALTSRYNVALAKPYTKTFTVKQADRSMPKVITKQLKIPLARSKQPVTITFSEPMDYGTLAIGLKIQTDNETIVNGAIHHQTDSIFTFVPTQVWQKGVYKLVLYDYVTDLAGNHLRRRFEEESLSEMSKNSPIEIPFTIE